VPGKAEDERQAHCEEKSDQADQQQQHPTSTNPKRTAPAKIAPRPSVQAGGFRLDVASRQAGKLRDRHEPEAARAQLRDQLLECGDGLAAVAAAVEETSQSLRWFRAGLCAEDLGNSGAALVRVVVRENDQVAIAGRALRGRVLQAKARPIPRLALSKIAFWPSSFGPGFS